MVQVLASGQLAKDFCKSVVETLERRFPANSQFTGAESIEVRSAPASAIEFGKLTVVDMDLLGIVRRGELAQ